MEEKVFVIMPSGTKNEYTHKREEADFIYREIICRALSEALGADKIKIERETDKALTGSINKSIIQSISEAKYCIVDITGHNPNVFFELGVRYSLWPRNTILLRQENQEIPFDIAPYRVIKYSPMFGSAELARQSLKEVLEACKDNFERTDSPVYDALPHLVVSNQARNGKDVNIMPWDEYMKQVERLILLLERKIKSEGYVPDIVIGITNGGLIFAEILVYRLQESVPLLSLWANRYSSEHPNEPRFENNYNRAVLYGLKKNFESRPNCQILLVDDNLSSGRTANEALTFVKKEMPDAVIRFLPLFSRAPKVLNALKDHLIWSHGAFSDLKIVPSEMHDSSRDKFPYLKEIVSHSH